jgi:DNA-binding transcriptional LysR family regulator
MFAAEAAAELELSELRGLTRGQLFVGASTTLGNYLIPAVFGAYNKAHPAIRLSLEIGNTAAIHGMVLDDRLDFGLSEGFVSSEQLDVEVVHEDEMVAIVSSDHPFRRRAQTSVSELVRAAFISREPGSGTREVIDAALAERGAAIEPTMVLGSTEAVKKAVAAGLGVAIVSHLAIELELRTGQLFVLPVEDLEIRRALHLVRLKGKRESAAAHAFITLMRSMFRQAK